MLAPRFVLLALSFLGLSHQCHTKASALAYEIDTYMSHLYEESNVTGVELHVVSSFLSSCAWCSFRVVSVFPRGRADMFSKKKKLPLFPVSQFPPVVSDIADKPDPSPWVQHRRPT